MGWDLGDCVSCHSYSSSDKIIIRSVCFSCLDKMTDMVLSDYKMTFFVNDGRFDSIDCEVCKNEAVYGLDLEICDECF